MEKPQCVREEHLEFLDELRESGVTNMLGARRYILYEFPDLSKQEAGEVLIYWMKTFGQRQGDPECNSMKP